MLEHSGEAPGGALWAIVLAGGEGVRLRPLVRELCGDERPKQFAKIVGSKSLLRHTLDRVCSEDPAGADGNRHVPCARQVYGAGICGDTEAACSCAARRSWYGRRHLFSGSLD